MRKTALIIFILALLLAGISVAYAQKGLGTAGAALQKAGEPTGLGGDFDVTAGMVVQGVIATVGGIFLILAVYAGFLWMTARGNETLIEKAKNTLTGAIIGLVITMAAYAISGFILREVAAPSKLPASDGIQQ